MPVILMIGQDKGQLDLVNRMLLYRGHTVLLADGPIEGMAAAVRELPDAVIVADISMIPMNGVELVEKLRSHEATAKFPILTLVPPAPIGTFIDGDLLHPISCVLEKPIVSEEFLGMIETMLAGSNHEATSAS